MKRKLLGSERAVWKRGAISLNLVVIAHIKGGIPPAQLKKSWQILQEKHPLLRVHLEQDQQTEFLVTKGTDDIPVREVTSTADGNWQTEALTELHTPFNNFSTLPLVRSVLVPSGDQVELIITCHHCICDGLSATYLIRDILHCLVGQSEHVQPSSADLLLDNMVPPAVKVPVLIEKGLRVTNFLFGKLKQLDHVASIPMQENRILGWNINKGQTAALLVACKKNKVTVHTAISTIFQAAQYAVQGDKEPFLKRMYTPISVRGKLTQNVADNFGLYASEAYIPCPYNPGKSFWENARDFQNNLRDALTDQKVFSSIIVANTLLPTLLDRLLLYLYKKQTIQFGYIISNLGNLNFPQKYGRLVLKGIHGPVGYVQRAEKTLTVLTVNKEMFFTFTYRPTVISAKTIASIKENAMKMLTTYTTDQ